jgi:hypothetical protein
MKELKSMLFGGVDRNGSEVLAAGRTSIDSYEGAKHEWRSHIFEARADIPAKIKLLVNNMSHNFPWVVRSSVILPLLHRSHSVSQQ